jgi:hypothetical protein
VAATSASICTHEGLGLVFYVTGEMGCTAVLACSIFASQCLWLPLKVGAAVWSE